MSQTRQNNEGLLDTLCEYYLPRVLHYINFWVYDIGKAEDISLKVLKNSISKIEGFVSVTESVSIKVFSLARESVKRDVKLKHMVLAGLSPLEREVISLKLGAEMTNRGIAAVLRIPEPKVNEIMTGSLRKMGKNTNLVQNRLG